MLSSFFPPTLPEASGRGAQDGHGAGAARTVRETGGDAVARGIGGELLERAGLPPEELRLAADGDREDPEVVAVEEQVRLHPEQLCR